MPKIPDEATNREVYAWALQAQTQEEADFYWDALVRRHIAMGPPGGPDAAPGLVLSNLKMLAGHYQDDFYYRVARLYGNCAGHAEEAHRA